MPRNPPQTPAMRQRTEELRRRASGFLKNPVRTILGTTPGWREEVRKRDAPSLADEQQRMDAINIHSALFKRRAAERNARGSAGPGQGVSTEYDANDINKPMGKVRPSR